MFLAQAGPGQGVQEDRLCKVGRDEVDMEVRTGPGTWADGASVQGTRVPTVLLVRRVCVRCVRCVRCVMMRARQVRRVRQARGRGCCVGTDRRTQKRHNAGNGGVCRAGYEQRGRGSARRPGEAAKEGHEAPRIVSLDHATCLGELKTCSRKSVVSRKGGEGGGRGWTGGQVDWWMGGWVGGLAMVEAKGSGSCWFWLSMNERACLESFTLGALGGGRENLWPKTAIAASVIGQHTPAPTERGRGTARTRTRTRTRKWEVCILHSAFCIRPWAWHSETRRERSHDLFT